MATSQTLSKWRVCVCVFFGLGHPSQNVLDRQLLFLFHALYPKNRSQQRLKKSDRNLAIQGVCRPSTKKEGIYHGNMKPRFFHKIP